ncbi:MAG: Hsp70 family protein [Planctomycetes bacterium]|nr:Hsp70 family protein [Planctomycetota bacterium]
METRNILAIDFGTTNTYFCKCPADQISPVGVDFGTGRDGLPTAILYRGNREPLVGEPALHEYGEAAPQEREGYRLHTQFKPDIVESEEAARAATDFLKCVVLQAQRQHIALDPAQYDVIFGVPSEAQAQFRAKLSQIAKAAGYGEVRLMDEPKGALLHHLWHKDFSPEEARRGILVIDFGGGTCDFAFLQSLQVSHSWGDMELGGRLFDDLFFQWFLEENPGALKAMEKAGDTYYVHSYVCREVKEFFSLTMARDRFEKVSKSVGRYGSLRGMDWPSFLDRAQRYTPSPTFIRHLEDMGLRAAEDGEGRTEGGRSRRLESAIRNPQSAIDLIDWFRTTLSHGLTEQGVDAKTISRVILAGGSSQWPFVADVVTDTLGVERSRLMRSDRPYAVIAQGLSILPALQKQFEETREELRRDVGRFCRTQVRPLVEKVTDSYIAGVAADMTTELFDKIIRPILEEFRQKGGSVKSLRETISAQVKASEVKITEIIEARMRTLRLGLPGELNELLRDWFGSYGLSVGEKPLEEAQQAGAGQELVQPSTPDLYGSIMDVVGWFVVMLAATVGAAISGGGGLHLLAAGPVGWIIGGVLVAVVAFLAVRYGTARAKELADSWNAPAWVVKNILMPSRIVSMRADFQTRLEETLRRETASLQGELESRIRTITEKQVESLSEIAQL